MAQYKTYKTLATDQDPNKVATQEGNILSVLNLQFRKDLIGNNKITVVYYYADWCGPCKDISGKYAQLSMKYSRPGIVCFAKEDVDNEIGNTPDQVYAVPCFHFYYMGSYQKPFTVTGANIEEFEQRLVSLLSNLK